MLLLLTSLAAVAVLARSPPAPPPVPVSCVPVERPPAPAPSTVPMGKRPHFLTILVDDLGWDDTAIHNEALTGLTPTIAALKKEGVVLMRHHTYLWCSPTRRSFLSGRFPVHISGMQAPTESNYLPLQFTILSEKLAAAQYESHFIGKHHLGVHTMDHLMANRGFRSNTGYLGGELPAALERDGLRRGRAVLAPPAPFLEPLLQRPSARPFFPFP